ncbi:MAG: hypothetical protein ACI90V_011051, partial [Bacillariaceae sp.]
ATKTRIERLDKVVVVVSFCASIVVYGFRANAFCY